jgi:hypothetical protein
MKHSFDVITVGVQDEGAVIAGMVGAIARGAVVFAACAESSLVESLDSVPVLSLEGQMHTRHIAFCLVHEQLVGVEKAGALYEYVWQSEGGENCKIEALADLHIRHSKMDVINEPATMELHGLLLSV